MAWAVDERRVAIRAMVPSVHAFYSVRWLASLDGLPVLAALMAFVLLLTSIAVLGTLLTLRAVKGLELGFQDRHVNSWIGSRPKSCCMSWRWAMQRRWNRS